jgi:thiamine biosynthesis lipoprotein
LDTLTLMRKPLLTILVVAIAAAPADVCARDRTGRLSRSAYSMGTLLEIAVGVSDGADSSSYGVAVDRAFAEVARLDTLLSTYKPCSEITTVNNRAGGRAVKVDPLVLAVLDSSVAYWRLTGGAFDPTVGPLLDIWGFKSASPRVPAAAELDSALSLVDAALLELDAERGEARLRVPGQKLDLGGIAKGYALDRAALELRNAGVKSALLNFGGNLLFMGEALEGTPWSAGVAHPRFPDRIVAKLKARDVAVSTSGDYENYFVSGGERYSHILDPRTGRPATELCSATVVARTGTGSDALSTALVALGPRAGMELVESLPGVEAVIILSAGVDNQGPLRLYVSSGLRESLEPAEGARLLTMPPSGR